MLVMRKFNCELAQHVRLGEGKALIVARRDFSMADSTDLRTRAFEKLLAVTTHTRLMTRVIRNVGKVLDLLPILSWNLVTGIARLLMFPGGMGKLGIIDWGV